MNTRIVTDSTCDLPDEIIDQLDIRVIPNYINIGEASYLDGLEMTHEDFYQGLAQYPSLPKTSTPGNGVFEATYRQLAEEGAKQIISIHIHTGLSNLSNVARIAGQSISDARVTVVEVGQLALGLGFLVQAAAEASQNGKAVEEILESICDLDKRTTIFAALDTLEYLKESGRAPALLVGIANLFHIKPIIQLHQGALRLAARVRTSNHGIDWLVKSAQKMGRLEKLAVLHTNALERAKELQNRIQCILPSMKEILITEATPILGVHVGPRAVGLVCVRSVDL
ncbi:MAG: DegV family protein [Chloroflexi bacterium]|nr:DegV family protein [Chloroflexota bacterium]